MPLSLAKVIERRYGALGVPADFVLPGGQHVRLSEQPEVEAANAMAALKDASADGSFTYSVKKSSFGAYVDRASGEMVIVVPEMPRMTWREFTSDCIRIRIRD